MTRGQKTIKRLRFMGNREESNALGDRELQVLIGEGERGGGGIEVNISDNGSITLIFF